jgi:hypothetical protein
MDKEDIEIIIALFLVLYSYYVSYISEQEDNKHGSYLEWQKEHDPESYAEESKLIYLSFRKNKNQAIKKYWKTNAISLYYAEQIVMERVKPFLDSNEQ